MRRSVRADPPKSAETDGKRYDLIRQCISCLTVEKRLTQVQVLPTRLAGDLPAIKTAKGKDMTITRDKIWYDLYEIIDSCVRDKISIDDATNVIRAKLEQEQEQEIGYVLLTEISYGERM